jgi:hypothetical protein
VVEDREAAVEERDTGGTTSPKRHEVVEMSHAIGAAMREWGVGGAEGVHEVEASDRFVRAEEKYARDSAHRWENNGTDSWRIFTSFRGGTLQRRSGVGALRKSWHNARSGEASGYTHEVDGVVIGHVSEVF